MQNNNDNNFTINKIISVAVIDPVGSKAGIDHYDLLLLNGIKEAGIETALYSNFEYNGTDIRYHKFFHNISVSKITAITNNFIGFIKSLLDAKKNRIDWLILHVFRAGMFDLFTFCLARLMGFKIAAIVHDIESLDTISIPFVRKIVVGYLPNVRVVHNNFCKEELIKSIGKSVINNTAIIPHVNFTDLFSSYHLSPEKYTELKFKKEIIRQIHPQLQNVIDKNIPVILFFGQIKKVKGIDILLEAVAQCKKNFVVVIAGKTRNESWEKYENIIRVLNIQKKILPVIRHISDEERDVLFAISAGVILPYRLIYQSGVLLMAMSFPMTVIASDLPPNRDLIQPEKNGILFNSENAADLAKKIDELLDNTELTSAMKQQALLDMKKLYSAKEIGVQYKELLLG